MKAARVVLVITCLVVAGLAVWFVVARWDTANKVAAAVGALAAVAAIGVAIWAALRGPSQSAVLQVHKTGDAIAHGGRANAGIHVGTGGALPSEARATRTGRAEASEGGSANTGIDLTRSDRQES